MTRLATGVTGLDVVLGGGLEPGSVTVLAGAPGTGKTILAQQICFAVATARRVVIDSLAEMVFAARESERSQPTRAA